MAGLIFAARASRAQSPVALQSQKTTSLEFRSCWNIGACDVPMKEVIDSLRFGLERPLIDQTGLMGNFDFLISYGTDYNLPTPPGGSPDRQSEGPSNRRWT